MPEVVPKNIGADPKVKHLSVKNWISGTVTDNDRTPLDGLKTSSNLWLSQDAVVGPRPSMVQYGPQPLGTVLGEIFEFNKVTSGVGENWLLCMQNVAGTTNVYKARLEDSSWTLVTGKTYDNTARAHFFQLAGRVGILNGADTFSYYDIEDDVITPFTAIGNPSSPTLGTNGVGGTGYNITYRVTANSTIGESAASNALTVPVDTDRDLWNPPSNGGTDQITISWSPVTGAQSYNVYMGVVAGDEQLIARAVTGTTFMDDGSFVQDNTTPYPTTNSTAGMKGTRGTVISGRVYITGDIDNPYYVWYGGDPGFELDFSPAHGGNYALVNDGGKELPVAVKLHRTGQGQSAIKVYCSGTKGKRFTITPESVTYAGIPYIYYAVDEDEGEAGTNAPDALLYHENNFYYPSTEGFETDGTLPQIQNVMTTKKVSGTIQRDISQLNKDAMKNACGMAMDGRLLFGLPVNSSTNNQVWVLDLNQKGAWMKPWNISADWMWVANDNSGNTRYLVLSGNKIYDLSYSNFTTDGTTAFQTGAQSGKIYFSEDKRMWVQLLNVTFILLTAQGEINFTISGKTEDTDLTRLGDPYRFTANANSLPMGWGHVGTGILGFGRRRWSGTNGVASAASNSDDEVIVEVDETIQWFSYSWATSKAGVNYKISDVIAEYIEVGILDNT